MHTLTTSHIADDNLHLVVGLDEYIDYFSCLEATMSRRDDRLQAYKNIFKQYHTKPSATSMMQLNRQQPVTFSEVESVKSSILTLNEHVALEVQKFHVQRCIDITSLFRTYFKSQRDYYEAVGSTWHATLPQIALESISELDLAAGLSQQSVVSGVSDYFVIHVSDMSKLLLFGFK